jgi:hypothetical protein
MLVRSLDNADGVIQGTDVYGARCGNAKPISRSRLDGNPHQLTHRWLAGAAIATRCDGHPVNVGLGNCLR